jgi:hypothetical protein
MDITAFREIVNAHRAAVFATIACITGQSSAVEEIAIDVFAAGFRLRESAECWEIRLVRLAAERSIQYLYSHPGPADRLAVLAPEERAAFVLRHGGARSEDEVCAILRISPGKLRKLLAKAHGRFTVPVRSGAWFVRLALAWKR